MHSRLMYWWGHALNCSAFSEGTGCGPFAPSSEWYRSYASSGRHGDYGRTALGVRRPLRLLAYKLGLNTQQVNELARILNELKTERAQAEVNEQRTLTAFADALTEATFDAEKASEGATLRVSSAERLREASVKALRQIHALLDVEQRAKLAYLIRTGIIAL
jgi:hypothetical protein